MGSITSHLIHAIEALERGSFEKALHSADHVIEMSQNNFWGWYLGAIALAFLKDEPSFIFYSEKAGKIFPGSLYFRYLQVYVNILQNREADAIVDLAKLVDERNGWFAKELLEKIRSGDKLKRYAQRGDIGKFVLIPDLKVELMRIAQDKEKLKHKKTNRNLWLLLFIFICCLIGILFTLRHLSFNGATQHKQESFKKIKIPTQAKVLKAQSTRSFLYEYVHPRSIINDFKKAKQLLKDRKVNQGRYFLQRIIHSNADFATKEKSKIFTGFIPEVFFEEFEDPISPIQALKEPKFYEGSQVLWEGVIKSNRTNNEGKQFNIMIREAGEEFNVIAFMKEQTSAKKQMPYSEYERPKRQPPSSHEKRIVIFGKFKGLIGKAKQIYVELDRVWL